MKRTPLLPSRLKLSIKIGKGKDSTINVDEIMSVEELPSALRVSADALEKVLNKPKRLKGFAHPMSFIELLVWDQTHQPAKRKARKAK